LEQAGEVDILSFFGLLTIWKRVSTSRIQNRECGLTFNILDEGHPGEYPNVIYRSEE
jgi:hypothetical protein